MLSDLPTGFILFLIFRSFWGFGFFGRMVWSLGCRVWGCAAVDSAGGKIFVWRYVCCKGRVDKDHARPFEHQKSIFEDFDIFWREMPTQWLQERANGSKNEPRIGFEGPGVAETRAVFASVGHVERSKQ